MRSTSRATSVIARRASVEAEIAAVRTLCRTLGLGEVVPLALKLAHHTTFSIPPLGLVARVQSGEPLAFAMERAGREVSVARHLAERGAPIIAPLDGELAGPHVIDGVVATLWPYLAHARTADDRDAVLAASTLGSVHRALRDYGGPLPRYTEMLDRCWQRLGEAAVHRRADRALLEFHFHRLRRLIESASAEPVPLHGDVHLGNLLMAGSGPHWCDFEDACTGPREFDIAGLPADVWSGFDDLDQDLIALCAGLKSVCVAIWCAADTSRSPEIMEAAAYHLARVREMPT